MPQPFEHKELGTPIPVNKATRDNYAMLCEVTREAMAKNIADHIFADDAFLRDYKPTPLTWRDKLRIYKTRIHDAWSVLLGKAEIGDGW